MTGKESKMAICRKCGAKLVEGDKFCRQCGSPVRQYKATRRVSRTPPTSKSGASRESYSKRRPSGGRSSRVLIPIVAVVLVAIVVIVVIAAAGNGSDGTPSGTTASISTPTPTLAPTPTPPPTSTPTVLLSDDFSDPSSGWLTYSDYEGSAFYQAGWLHIRDEAFGELSEACYAGQNFADFVLEVETKLVAGTDNN